MRLHGFDSLPAPRKPATSIWRYASSNPPSVEAEVHWSPRYLVEGPGEQTRPGGPSPRYSLPCRPRRHPIRSRGRCSFTNTAPTEIYTLSLHDAGPILSLE